MAETTTFSLMSSSLLPLVIIVICRLRWTSRIYQFGLSVSFFSSSSSSLKNRNEMTSTPGLPSQKPYIRNREHPYFHGLLRGDNTSKDQTRTLVFQGNGGRWNISRTSSDISDARSNGINSPSGDSVSDIALHPLPQSAFGRLSNVSEANSVGFSSFQSDLIIDLGDTCESMKESSPKISEVTEDYHVLSNVVRPVVEKCYSMNQTKQNLSKMPLPQSAASFYNGFSLQAEIAESCKSIKRLNLYLQARRDDVCAGVPGRFLHAVIAQDVSDVGSIAATIMYAFYLNETLENDQLCIIPVINMKRTDLGTRTELKWLLNSCQVDEPALIFSDEIDLSYYNLFGSLQLVLLNGNKFPTKMEACKGAIVEIFNCRKGASVYSEVESLIAGQESSSCTLIAEKFAQTSPEILAGQGFSRLLLAGILLDTGNLTNPHCTTKDYYMATLLINGAGQFGLNGLYNLLSPIHVL